MKTLLALAVATFVTFAQQPNTQEAYLAVVPPPPPVLGQTYPINVTCIEVSGTPGQPFMLFIADGAPWYGAVQIAQGSVDLAPWASPVGIVLLAEGTLSMTGDAALLVSGPILAMNVSLQAAVWDPLAANGFTLTAAVHVSF